MALLSVLEETCYARRQTIKIEGFLMFDCSVPFPVLHLGRSFFFCPVKEKSILYLLQLLVIAGKWHVRKSIYHQ